MVRVAIILVAALMTLLQGCLAPQRSDSDAIEHAGASREGPYVPEAGLSERERFIMVLELLNSGAAERARAELLVYLKSNPNSGLGQDLLRQIEEAPSVYFPSSSYREIKLRSGQSLSTIANDYLGSIYKFYALAKFNGISQPKRLTIGQVIRVPLTREARAAFAALQGSSEAVSEDPTKSEAETLPAGNEVDDTSIQTRVGETVVAADPEKDSQSDTLERNLGAPIEKGDLSEVFNADKVLEESESSEQEIATESPEILEQGWDGSSSLPAPAAGPEVGVEATNANRVLDLHRQALRAYRAQDLDSAIALWNEVLEFDPNHERARLYKAQALEMQRRLINLR